jgi:hypothetical protein
MSWLISAKQYIPAVIGEEFGGGYFAGYISHTADGNPTHALIVAPRATGATGTGYTVTTNLAWKNAATTTSGTTSSFNGSANTSAMVTAGIADHPAANFCVGLSIEGYNDWYLPSRYELEIAYFNLKPGTASNYILDADSGINSYAVPQRPNKWTAEYPAQTNVSLFAGGTQSFSTSDHWSSSESTATQAWRIFLVSGRLAGTANKASNTYAVRAFRRIAL